MTPADARRIGLDERIVVWLAAHGRLDGVELANEAVRRRLHDGHLAHMSEGRTNMHTTVRRITSIIVAVAFATPACAAATHPKPARRHVKRPVPATLSCTMHPVPGLAIPC